jgi:hypothetical protein
MNAANDFNYQEAFGRNIGLVSEAEQAAMRRTCIALPGLGGVGGGHLTVLARMGFGAFHLADFDVFETANIQRQVGATVNSLGRTRNRVFRRATTAHLPPLARPLPPRFCCIDYGGGITGYAASLSENFYGSKPYRDDNGVKILKKMPHFAFEFKYNNMKRTARETSVGSSAPQSVVGCHISVNPAGERRESGKIVCKNHRQNIFSPFPFCAIGGHPFPEAATLNQWIRKRNKMTKKGGYVDIFFHPYLIKNWPLPCEVDKSFRVNYLHFLHMSTQNKRATRVFESQKYFFDFRCFLSKPA